MEPKRQLKPGDFKSSRAQFTRTRQQKPSKEDVLSILDNGKKRPLADDPNKKTAKDRDADI